MCGVIRILFKKFFRRKKGSPRAVPGSEKNGESFTVHVTLEPDCYNSEGASRKRGRRHNEQHKTYKSRSKRESRSVGQSQSDSLNPRVAPSALPLRVQSGGHIGKTLPLASSSGDTIQEAISTGGQPSAIPKLYPVSTKISSSSDKIRYRGASSSKRINPIPAECQVPRQERYLIQVPLGSKSDPQLPSPHLHQSSGPPPPVLGEQGQFSKSSQNINITINLPNQREATFFPDNYQQAHHVPPSYASGRRGCPRPAPINAITGTKSNWSRSSQHKTRYSPAGSTVGSGATSTILQDKSGPNVSGLGISGVSDIIEPFGTNRQTWESRHNTSNGSFGSMSLSTISLAEFPSNFKHTTAETITESYSTPRKRQKAAKGHGATRVGCRFNEKGQNPAANVMHLASNSREYELGACSHVKYEDSTSVESPRASTSSSTTTSQILYPTGVPFLDPFANPHSIRLLSSITGISPTQPIPINKVAKEVYHTSSASSQRIYLSDSADSPSIAKKFISTGSNTHETHERIKTWASAIVPPPPPPPAPDPPTRSISPLLPPDQKSELNPRAGTLDLPGTLKPPQYKPKIKRITQPSSPIVSSLSPSFISAIPSESRNLSSLVLPSGSCMSDTGAVIDGSVSAATENRVEEGEVEGEDEKVTTTDTYLDTGDTDISRMPSAGIGTIPTWAISRYSTSSASPNLDISSNFPSCQQQRQQNRKRDYQTGMLGPKSREQMQIPLGLPILI